MTVILVCQMLIAWGIAYHLVIKYDYYLGFVAVYFCSSRSYRCMYAFSPIYLSPLLKENVRPRRKRILDDALFEFFRKEAIKSLKRDFAKFCNESVIFSKRKRLKEHAIGRESFTSYSIKYFCEIVKSLTDRRKNVIRNFGFGCLLLLEKCEIPSAFVRWICGCVNHVTHQIVVNDSKSISISKDSIHYAIGLSNSGCVPIPDSEAGADFLLKMFGLPELPHITFFVSSPTQITCLSFKIQNLQVLLISVCLFLNISSLECIDTTELVNCLGGRVSVLSSPTTFLL
ncbi:uncharacterized protein LOC124649005 [Lolium rigidum]|uniref:uncharacterized protein LOC124649005 n=1 Tax=Lolium rigidum TaxID=89674 RepID=UPI001F5CD454|nr:uncharacterized protein LOC124649005 [Lolium rigidum]